MNQQQIKYARERLNQIYRHRQDKLGSRYNYGFTTEEKKALYEDGRVGIDYKNGNFVIVFDGEEERREEQNNIHKTLTDEYNRAMDELMLGDAEEALKIINEFAKGE